MNGASESSTGSLPRSKTIGHIETVFEFYDAMPTGVSVSADERIFITFPQWGDDVQFTVGEIKDVNQLKRQAEFNEGKDLREKPYTVFRIKVDGGPVLLK